MGLVDSQEQFDERIACLAHNLAIAGGLCRAFELGCEFTHEWFKRDPFYPFWEPGIGHDVAKANAFRASKAIKDKAAP